MTGVPCTTNNYLRSAACARVLTHSVHSKHRDAHDDGCWQASCRPPSSALCMPPAGAAFISTVRTAQRRMRAATTAKLMSCSAKCLLGSLRDCAVGSTPKMPCVGDDREAWLPRGPMAALGLRPLTARCGASARPRAHAQAKCLRGEGTSDKEISGYSGVHETTTTTNALSWTQALPGE